MRPHARKSSLTIEAEKIVCDDERRGSLTIDADRRRGSLLTRYLHNPLLEK